jgi:uncharacterized membrane protein YeaQ/YmgE (transglycosylase-associated protein family)
VGILAWAIFGLITGFLASKVVNDRGEGCVLNVALGLVGAMVGGFLFRTITGRDVAFHFDLTSIFVAVIGAVIVLYLYHAVAGSRRLR